MDNVNALLAKVFGVVLVLVGILGFVPNPVAHDPTETPNAIFHVNGIHNVIHLLTGGILLAAGFAGEGRNARQANQILGVVYLLVAVLGLANVVVDSIVVANMADDLLHVLLAIVLLAVGFGVKDASRSPSRA